MLKLSPVFRLLFIVVFSFSLFACSSKSLIKTYDGVELPREKTAALIAGENVSLLTVNGQPVPEYLLSTAESRYGLKPGKNTVTFKYTSVWATAPSAHDDSRAVRVESEPVKASFEANAGDTLNFVFESVDNIREARELAASFEASMVDAKGKTVATSYKPDPGAVMSRQASRPDESENEAQKSGPADVSSDNPNENALGRLKQYWEKASPQERQQFLKWAL